MKKAIKYVICVLSAAAVLAVGLGFVITPEISDAPNESVSGIKPFNSQSGASSNYYRIPSLITARDGSLVAAVDARFGGTHDSPNNLDTAVSLSHDGGENWADSFLVLNYQDYENSKTILKANGKLTTKDSASFIDPSMLLDRETGRIYMIVDAYPDNSGSMSSQTGSGYIEKDGAKYLSLCKKGEKEYNYYVDDNNDIVNVNGEKTEYLINSKFELLENGNPLKLPQKKTAFWYNVPFSVKTGEEVNMNIMYKDALFKPLRTTYIYLIYSDDNGKSWSDPVDLNPMVKAEDKGFMGVCPGRGIQLENGEFAGRLIFTAYYLNPENMEQKFTAIYSDDHGKTWKCGDSAELTDEISSMSETQLVELPDGSIKAFSRTTSGFVGSAISRDGGVSWSKPELEDDLVLTGGSGCQISVINSSVKIDGKDAAILSAPKGESRKNGFIYVGLIEKDGGEYEIDWKYSKEITESETYFAYSCLTQLENGDVGILYEKSNTPQSIDTTVFEKYSIQDLCREKTD